MEEARRVELAGTETLEDGLTDRDRLTDSDELSVGVGDRLSDGVTLTDTFTDGDTLGDGVSDTGRRMDVESMMMSLIEGVRGPSVFVLVASGIEVELACTVVITTGEDCDNEEED